MQKIRILTIEMPKSPLLQEIFKLVAENRKDMKIVETPISKSQLIRKIKKIEADVVIVDLEEHELPKLYTELSTAISSAVIVGIVDDGRRILVNAKQVGVKELMNAIRALMRNRYKYNNIYKEQCDQSFKLH